MPEIAEENFYLGLYYFEFPLDSPLLHTFGPFGLGGNILAQVWAPDQQGEPKDKTNWIAHLRFRYYKDERIGEHNEDLFRSQAYAIDGKTLSEVEGYIHEIMRSISVAALSPIGPRYECIPLKCQGGEEMIQKCIAANKPWMHVTKLTEEQAEARGLIPRTKPEEPK